MEGSESGSVLLSVPGKTEIKTCLHYRRQFATPTLGSSGVRWDVSLLEYEGSESGSALLSEPGMAGTETNLQHRRRLSTPTLGCAGICSVGLFFVNRIDALVRHENSDAEQLLVAEAILLQ